MSDLKQWYVIINPKAGNGKGLKKWSQIQLILNNSGFDFEYAFTKYHGHSKEIVENSISKGYRHFICVGGDGTLHHLVNGIMSQKNIETSKIHVGIIPIGTGNDWVKTYAIPKDISKAVNLIKNANIECQDIGRIDFLSSEKSPTYFMNLAGIGFDGYVAKKADKLKNFGSLSYLFAALKGLFLFENFNVGITTTSEKHKTKSLMVLIGLCQFSGGNMQLTHAPSPKDGLFDITNITSFTKWDIIKNIANLYNGKVNIVKKVKTLKDSTIEINVDPNIKGYIQMDGEVIDAESFSANLIPNAFYFYC